MGLSASQARQLLLTAKRNDLEFRAQQISQQRLILSSQLEDIATDYENVTANRQMQIQLYLNAPQNDSTKNLRTTNLTYKDLVSGNFRAAFTGSSFLAPSSKVGTDSLEYSANNAYVLKNATGAIVVSDLSEIPGFSSLTPSNKNTFNAEIDDNGTEKDAIDKKSVSGEEISGYGEPSKISMAKNGVITVDFSDGKSLKYVVDKALKYGSTDTNGNKAGPNYLQDCLRNGTYLLERGTATVDETTGQTTEIKWTSISWDSASAITDKYYTEDDDAAKAKYDRLQNEIQRQDKKLELELDNIETQRSAITTEEESVQKVMDDNIEGTFKTFA